MAVDDEDRPAAGDITTVLPATAAAAAGLKRPLAEMSRSNSFSSGTATAAPSAASAAPTAMGGAEGGARSRRG